MPRNKEAVTAYLPADMIEFLDAVKWENRYSRSEQIEVVLTEWKEQWFNEHGGPEALETIKKWTSEYKRRLLERKQRRAKGGERT